MRNRNRCLLLVWIQYSLISQFVLMEHENSKHLPGLGWVELDASERMRRGRYLQRAVPCHPPVPDVDLPPVRRTGVERLAGGVSRNLSSGHLACVVGEHTPALQVGEEQAVTARCSHLSHTIHTNSSYS